ncbi:hypothetical protein Tco_0459860 [Tanacetum coccineum]
MSPSPPTTATPVASHHQHHRLPQYLSHLIGGSLKVDLGGDCMEETYQSSLPLWWNVKGSSSVVRLVEKEAMFGF